MAADAATTVPRLYAVATRDDLVDWGPQPAPLAGQSHSRGRLVFKGPDNRSEAGLWVCTPGRWRLQIPRDELCHFLAGRATYVSDAGERIEIEAGTVVLFPGGWSGECMVHETIRNTYMLT
jgi:uncharacterized cupin superfamily protein